MRGADNDCENSRPVAHHGSHSAVGSPHVHANIISIEAVVTSSPGGPSLSAPLTQPAVCHLVNRGDGELEALREALRHVEAVLAKEQGRAAALRDMSQGEAQARATTAAQLQTLSQQLNEERNKRKELRMRLAEAADHLRASVEKASLLTSALAAVQEEGQTVRDELAVRKHELKQAKHKIAALHLELSACRGDLETAEISRDSSKSSASRLREQLAATRAQGIAQAAALAASAAATQRMQAQATESKNQERAAAMAALARQNEDLRVRLTMTQAELGLVQEGAARMAARADGSSRHQAAQRQTMSDMLRAVQNEAARHAARAIELQGQVDELKKECRRTQVEAAATVRNAHQALTALNSRLELVKGRETRKHREALSAFGNVFQEISERLCDTEERLRREEARHRGTRGELEAAHFKCKAARQGKLAGDGGGAAAAGRRFQI